jgi:hypothetical protein
MPTTLPPASDDNRLPVEKRVRLNQPAPEPQSRVARRIRVSRARQAAVVLAVGCGLGLATACGSAYSTEKPAPPLPSAVRAVCGHPGSTVTLERLPVTIRHGDCDLTGVEVRYGMTGITVPSSGTVGAVADGISSSTTLIAEIDPTTGDVTFHE